MAVFSTVSRRREHCHSADALSLSLLIHLLKAEGSAAEWQNSRQRLAVDETIILLKRSLHRY